MTHLSAELCQTEAPGRADVVGYYFRSGAPAAEVGAARRPSGTIDRDRSHKRSYNRIYNLDVMVDYS